MSRAASGGTDPLILVAVLVVGAMMYSRTMKAQAQNVAGRTAYVPASATGARGSGAAQIAGGLLGSAMDWFRSGGNGASVPDTYNGTATTLNSFGLYGDIGGTADDPWYG